MLLFFERGTPCRDLSFGKNRCLRITHPDSLIANDGSNLHLIRASDGKVIWTTAVAASFHEDDHVIRGFNRGRVFCLSSLISSYKHLPESVNIEVIDASDRSGIALVLGYYKPSKASSATGFSELSSVNIQLSISDAQNSVVSQVETVSLENLENGPQSCITVKTIEGQSSWYLICLTKGIASQSVLQSIGLKDMANQKWHVVKIQEAKICAKATLNGRDYLFSAFQEMNRPWENFALSVYQLDSGEPALNLTPGLWTIATHHGAVEWVGLISPSIYNL
ncbi:hypothetical protein FGIG_04516 [Fasciola gigantica]|uniref:Uncharacterized protein n=1 Tax=Fasciola gigantica TaxID=46835 RepID=A0A504YFB1_FASGI|nr:hypothetical protein FGIG_04516 [Fasciola gigantica]